MPSDIVSFTLTVHNRGKRGKDSEVAELHVEFSSLGNGEEREEWYTLSGLTPIGEWGSLRLRTRYVSRIKWFCLLFIQSHPSPR